MAIRRHRQRPRNSRWLCLRCTRSPLQLLLSTSSATECWGWPRQHPGCCKVPVVQKRTYKKRAPVQRTRGLLGSTGRQPHGENHTGPAITAKPSPLLALPPCAATASLGAPGPAGAPIGPGAPFNDGSAPRCCGQRGARGRRGRADVGAGGFRPSRPARMEGPCRFSRAVRTRAEGARSVSAAQGSCQCWRPLNDGGSRVGEAFLNCIF